MNPRIAQRVELSANGWTGPSSGRIFSSPWALEHGFAGEDWNLSVQDSTDGALYGFAQGRVADGRGDRFDILFFVRGEDGQFRAAYAYLNAEHVEIELVKALGSGRYQRRVAQLEAGGLPRRRVLDDLEGIAPLWKVRLEDVRVFDDLPSFAPLRREDLRFSNAYDYAGWKDWDTLLRSSRPLIRSVAEPAPRPRVRTFTLTRYRAFAEAKVELAPLTFLIGRNNAGKSAICRAPWLATRSWLKGARLPFPLRAEGLDLGESIKDLIYQGDLQGLEVGARLEGVPDLDEVSLGVGYLGSSDPRQLVTALTLTHGQRVERLERPGWAAARARLESHKALDGLARGVRLMLGLRDLPERGARWDGYAPEVISETGRGAYDLWAGLMESNDADPRLAELQRWAKQILLVKPELEIVGGRMEVRVSRSLGGRGAHLLDSGAGVGQALPLLVMLTLAAPSAQPWLYCLEQPELHLHPRAHPELTELMVQLATSPQGPWFLVETHSDAMILRARVLIAEGKIPHDQVRIYFVDEVDGGSELKAIPLDEQGTPKWWPDGVFAETHQEFLRLRRAIAAQRSAR